MRNLTVELRPKSFSEVIGNQKNVDAIQNLLRDRPPLAWLLSGPPGTGKTTLAELISANIQTEDSCILRVNCAITNGVEYHRELAERSFTLAWNGFRVFILNEAQELTGQAQKVWLDVLENKELPTTLIFTTSEPDKITPALRQRCAWFRLDGVTGQDRAELISRSFLAADCKHDPDAISNAIAKADITSPRAIVWAVERYAAGVSAEDAVDSAELPTYGDIAKEVLSGHWKVVAPLLRNLKPQDAKGFRQVLAAFMRNALIQYGNSEAAAVLRELALYSSFEPGIDLGALISIIYSYCAKKRG